MTNLKRAIEFTQEVAQRFNLTPPFSQVFARENDRIYELRVDVPALRNFLAAVRYAFDNESDETHELITAFVGLMDQILEDLGQETSEDCVN